MSSEARPAWQEMIAYLRRHRIEGVAMVRAPPENEPLNLSLG
jgi:hypothetical protein